MRQKRLVWLVVVIVLCLFVAGAFFHTYRKFFHTSMVKDKPVIIRLLPGQSLTSLTQQLHRAKLIHQPRLFYWMARAVTNPRQWQAGEYVFKTEMTVSDLLRDLRKGNVKVRRFTIVGGWTMAHLMSVLMRDKTLLQTIDDSSKVMYALGKPSELPEGRFLPATYNYRWGESDLAILSRAYAAMQRYISRAWAKRASGLPIKTPYEALIVASMIEKESAVRKDRHMIAGVIYNRMRDNMRLQVDPTVFYAMTLKKDTAEYSGMRSVDSLFNTYRHRGLPPTPICMPSKSAIEAALHPTVTKALYYVAKGDGRHHRFSRTYAQHLHAVGLYRAILQKRWDDQLLSYPITLHHFRRAWQHHCSAVMMLLPFFPGSVTVWHDWGALVVHPYTIDRCKLRPPQKHTHQGQKHG